MKSTNLSLRLTLLLLLAVLPAFAAEPGHDHSKLEAGPNGGRLIQTVEPHAEFLVTKERRIEVRFIDDAGKVVAPADQTVTVTMGDRSEPTKLTFTRTGDALISSGPIPDGNDAPTVVQIKVTPEAKTVIAKFNLDLNTCPECQLGEYACICAHAEEKK